MNKENNSKPYFGKDDKHRYIAILILFFLYGYFVEARGDLPIRWHYFTFKVYTHTFIHFLSIAFVSYLFSSRKENNFSSIFLALTALYPLLKEFLLLFFK
jgi:hypothetical protein